MSERWNRFLEKVNCTGCQKRRDVIREAIRKLTLGEGKAAVMFSGGLDSTYAAIKLSESYDVTLYHVIVEYLKDMNTNAGEVDAAHDIAWELGMEIEVLGKLSIEKKHCGKIMRVPTIGAMLICHREINGFKVLGTGLTPSNDPRDRQWADILNFQSKSCIPGLKIVHPRDGISRADQWEKIPKNVRPMILSCIEDNGNRCGKCYKCLEDKLWMGIKS